LGNNIINKVNISLSLSLMQKYLVISWLAERRQNLCITGIL